MADYNIPDYVEKRIRYFDGEFLKEQDFIDEQKYHVNRQRLQNRLHTPGLVRGLDVNAKVGDSQAVVEPGAALDIEGRLIVLAGSRTLELTPHANQTVLVVISYPDKEEASDLAPEGGEGETRWHEKPRVEIIPEVGAPPRDTHIRLARIRLDANGKVELGPDDRDFQVGVRVSAGAKVGDELTVQKLTLSREGVSTGKWPALTCADAGLADVAGSLRVNGDLPVSGGGSYGGRVGIGTTRPGEILHVVGGAPIFERSGKVIVFNPNFGQLNTHAMIVTGHTASPSTMDLRLQAGNDNSSNGITIKSSGNVGIGTTSPTTLLHVQAPGNSEGGIYWRDGDNADLSIYRDAQVGDWSLLRSDRGNGIAIIGPPDVVSVAVSRTSGNVGIGTTNPQRKLEISGDISGISIEGFAASPNAGAIRFGDKTGWKLHIGRSRESTGGALNSGIAGVLMTIQDNGNVGIGTDKPQKNLHVAGDVQIDGKLIAPNKQGFIVDQFVNTLGETLEQGDVVVIGDNQTSLYYGPDNIIPIPEVDLTDQAYDTRVCGIVADVRGELMAQATTKAGAKAKKATKAKRAKERRKTAVMEVRTFASDELAEMDHTEVKPGQVGGMITLGAYAYCKVDADIAPIKVGDLLTTSPTPGHAQKVLDSSKAVGAILGKALGSLKKGKGKIPVLVMLQ
jgi:hypothetical protein